MNLRNADGVSQLLQFLGHYKVNRMLHLIANRGKVGYLILCEEGKWKF